MPRPRALHLHDDQMDGHLHPACGRVPSEAPASLNPRILQEDAFERLPVGKRCHYCARLHWPLGGAPLNIGGSMYA